MKLSRQAVGCWLELFVADSVSNTLWKPTVMGRDTADGNMDAGFGTSWSSLFGGYGVDSMEDNI